MPTVFRWNITRREQLGRLVADELAPDLSHGIDELRRCCARVIAMAGDSRLVFIGRSPESLYDYLTGALAGTSWADRVTLLNLSLKTYSDRLETDAASLAAIREHFREIGLDPANIATSPHPIALVDLIYQGETFGKLLEMIFSFAADAGVDHRAVRRRLRIVGITERSESGPKTVRWQRLPWAARFRPSSLRGVAIPSWFWGYLGDVQKKVSRSNPPSRWADPDMARPPRGPQYAEALGLALTLHDTARRRDEREKLATTLAKEEAMRYSWFRRLVLELR
jgi:hypothetical protein